jgi:hypothetical protein
LLAHSKTLKARSHKGRRAVGGGGGRISATWGRKGREKRKERER